MAQQPSMILDMLKTPQQVREEQLAKLRQDSAAQAQLLGAPVQATTALPGLLSRFAAGEALEQRVDLNKAARRASGAVGSALKMAGYDEAAKAATQAFVSPEERLAGNRQEILKGLDQSNPQELALAAKKLQSMGDTQGANALVTRAQELEKNAAQTALVREQARTELSKRLKNMAAANKSDAEREQLIAESGLRLSELETKILLNETRATKTSAETDQLNALLPFKIDELIANIALTESKQGKTEEEIATIIAERDPNISLTKARTIAQAVIAEKNKAETKQIYDTLELEVKERASRVAYNLARTDLTTEQMATEIVRRMPELKNLEADTANKIAQGIANDALARKRNVEIGAIEAKLPGELALQQAKLLESSAKTDEMRSQIDLNRKRLSDLGLTDFMREVNASGLSDAEKQKIIRERVETRARTGDTLTKDYQLEQQFTAYSAVIETGEKAFASFRMAEKAVRILPAATTGVAAEPRAYLNKLVVGMGLGTDDMQRTAIADELMAVISGGLALENAQNLKGSFSDNDIRFIMAQTPNAGWNAKALELAFNAMYVQKFAEYKTAEAFDSNLGNFDSDKLRKLPISESRRLMEQKFRKVGLEQLNIIREQQNQQPLKLDDLVFNSNPITQGQ